MYLKEANKTIVDALKLPKIIELKKNLYCASFTLMKLLPANYIIDQAKKEGKINKDTTIIETSSGTFGLGLAMICNMYKYKLIVVSDPVIDDDLKRRMEDLGAKVEIVQKPSEEGGFQGARLNRLKELKKEISNSYWPNQYDNPFNAESYSAVAELVAETIGQVDFIVGSVGSGGSMSGTTTYLRKVFPNLYSIGVDTNGSVLFGQKDKKRILRGLGNSLHPKNLNYQLFDEVHWVEASQAFMSTRKLHQEHTLFMGGTSGASYLVADWCAKHNPNSKILVLFPDEGYRYQSTIYNDSWLKENDLWLCKLPTEPKTVSNPNETENDWYRILWNRRRFEEVVSAEANKGELLYV